MKKGARKNKAQNKQLSSKDMGEEVLSIVIKNSNLFRDTIKLLRLTNKHIKVAADEKITVFTLREYHQPDAVQRSGLLQNIKRLTVCFYLDHSALNGPNIKKQGYHQSHAQKLSRCLGLLNLVVDICSKSLEILDIAIRDSLDIALACSGILGNSDWESLGRLYLCHPMPAGGFLSGILARSTCFPALETLCFQAPMAEDIEFLSKAAFVSNLNDLSMDLFAGGDAEQNRAMIAAMRSLLQKAINVRELKLSSKTFEFFDSEFDCLGSLESLHLETPDDSSDLVATHVGFGPVLAQPWATLKDIHIERFSLKGHDLVRIFEAENTLPVLEKLVFKECTFTLDANMRCVRRPHLEEFHLEDCYNAHNLLSNLAQLMNCDAEALPNLRDFRINCLGGGAPTSTTISEFLSCPCMAALERLDIIAADIGPETGLLSSLANYCPRLTYMDFRYNNFGRPAVALLLGYIWTDGRVARAQVSRHIELRKFGS